MIQTDAHHHIWELARRLHAWLDGSRMAAIRRDFTLTDLALQTKAADIDRMVLVQVLPSPAETAGFLALAGESDLVAGVVGWADLTSTAIPETLAVLRSGPGGARLVGIRHLVQGEPDPRWLARPDVRRGLPGSPDNPSAASAVGAITRAIGAASAHGARGRASHNPPVVGSSPTRPTSHARPYANAAGQVWAPKTSTLHRATPLRLIRASAVIKETLRASAMATY